MLPGIPLLVKAAILVRVANLRRKEQHREMHVSVSRAVDESRAAADLSIAIQLQAACAHSIHDGRIVDDAHRYLQGFCPQLKVCVCRCPATSHHSLLY